MSGEITDIKTSGTKKITIEKSNGKEVTYELTDDVTIKEGSSTKKLSYLDEGMDVKLTLNKKDEVTKIEIDEDSDTVSGEVTKTKTSGTKYIEIEKSNGKEAKYYLTDKVTIKEDGSTKSLAILKRVWKLS